MPAADQDHQRLDARQWRGPGEPMKEDRWAWQSAGGGGGAGRSGGQKTCSSPRSTIIWANHSFRLSFLNSKTGGQENYNTSS